jgi:hypothetical protein
MKWEIRILAGLPGLILLAIETLFATVDSKKR